MKNKTYLIILSIILVSPLILSFSPQIIDPAFGDPDISSPHFTSNLQIFYFGIDSTFPTIQLVSPEQGTMDTDGVIRFIFIPTDNNEIINCSLVYQNGIYTTLNNPIKDVENIIEVVGVNDQHPLYNDDLQWGINCTDLFNNQGASEIRNLDTRDDAGGGGIAQGIIKGTDLDPKYINILYSATWIPGKENIIKIEAFNQQNKLFKPQNITFDFNDEFLTLVDLDIEEKETKAEFFAENEIPKGTYEIIISVIDETTIEKKIEVKIGRDIIEVVKTYKETLRRYKTTIWIVLGVLVIAIICFLILIDRYKKKRKT